MDWIGLIKTYLRYFTQNGLGISLLLGYLLPKYIRYCRFVSIDKYLGFSIYLSYFTMLLLALAYWAYPNYLDHVESTVAMLGLMVKAGGALYPSIDSYTLHGLLYGPLLTETQAIFQWLPFDAITNSKIPGVFAFMVFALIASSTLRNVVSRGYLIILLMFGPYVFWTRAEPLFLLICITSWVACLRPSSWRWPVLGFAAGLATALKLHGFLYIFPFMCISWMVRPLDAKKTLQSLAWSICGGILALSLCFAPSSISVKNYWAYISLASHHEILYELAEKNLIYSFLMQIPVLTIFCWKSSSFNQRVCYGLIGFSIFLVSIAGAKAGAGLHHLMPFVIVNACLLEIFSDRGNRLAIDRLKYAFLLLSAYFLFSDMPKMVRSAIGNNDTSLQIEAREELVSFQARYPDMLMGVTENTKNYYSYTFYRVFLQAQGSQQIDPPAFMDLSYAGVSDDSLVRVFEYCNRPIVVMPNRGVPFSILNFYTSAPLFSDSIRNAFSKHYHKIKQGEFFDIYQCSP
ncbi:hypothetical protein [Limnohabitans sp. JirII-29]|uniref:hypothetical protein n=1 Tax=Limnohabitans sp. JirII-29 TaxID=1835756 RepID=UPI0011B2651E|nr:hypothetical protein [Limnohabitans sp. JirII-29]